MLRLPPWLAWLLLILAVYDLRVELRLIADHFTLAELNAAISNHPLAVVVLLIIPLLLVRRQR
jgi:hypothetical protein